MHVINSKFVLVAENMLQKLQCERTVAVFGVMFKFVIPVKTIFDDGLVVDVVRNVAEGFIFGDMFKKSFP